MIHRGRDHGLPTYTEVRASCGFEPATAFSDLNNTIDQDVIESLSQNYQVIWHYKTRFKGKKTPPILIQQLPISILVGSDLHICMLQTILAFPNRTEFNFE